MNHSFENTLSGHKTLTLPSGKRARVHIGYGPKNPLAHSDGRGLGEGNFIAVGVRKIMNHSFEKSSGMGHYGLRKISHGVYPECAEGFEMTDACSLLSFRADARNLSPGIFHYPRGCVRS